MTLCVYTGVIPPWDNWLLGDHSPTTITEWGVRTINQITATISCAILKFSLSIVCCLSPLEPTWRCLPFRGKQINRALFLVVFLSPLAVSVNYFADTVECMHANKGVWTKCSAWQTHYRVGMMLIFLTTVHIVLWTYLNLKPGLFFPTILSGLYQCLRSVAV